MGYAAVKGTDHEVSFVYRSEGKEKSVTTDMQQQLTTNKELWGWYMYEASSSGWSGSVLAIFLPLLFATIATDQAWSYYGSGTPDYCGGTLTVNCLKCVPGKGDRFQTADGLVDLPDLKVYIGNIGISPISYTTVALGISVIFQLFLFMTCGPFVDYGNSRKKVMGVTTVIGALGSILCIVMYKPELWWVGSVLLVIANSSYGLGYIAYNSYLSILTDYSPEMRDAMHQNLPEDEQQQIRSKVENKISLVGITVGSVSGALCIAVSFGVAAFPNLSASFTLRVACVIGGVWWLVGYIPTALWLKERPGAPLPDKITPWLGWQNVWDLLMDSKKHKYAFRFLIIFFVYSDGYTTVNQVGILFAQQELCMSTVKLAAVALLVSIFALVGNPCFAILQRKLNLDNNQMVIFTLVLMSILPIYGLLGFFAPIGLKHESEMYPFACWYGLSLGAVFSYSRTLFVDLIPQGKEAAMFSLWSLSSRGSAWIGPIVVGIVYQYTKNLRGTFIYVLLVIAAPVVLLWLLIDNKQGLIDAGRMFPTDSHVVENHVISVVHVNSEHEEGQSVRQS